MIIGKSGASSPENLPYADDQLAESREGRLGQG